jgi:hypothetical protein
MTLTDKLAAERRARLAAERLLELKSRELFEANRKLSQHALSLSGQIIEQRGEAEKLKEESAQAQAELQRAEAHVEIVERRLWDSVETITDGFAVFDAQDRLVAANTAWLSIFGFSTRIGPGTLYLEVLRCAVEEGHVLTGEEPASAWIGRMLERWDTEPPVAPETIRTRTGAWYRLVDRRARDGDMVCVAQDVTALKEREAELDEARHRAEAANRAKSAFLANMSHELRTPMNGVVGMADMLLESGLEDEHRTYVSTIKSSGEALLEIINNVLDLSKMEAERLVLRPAPFDFERLVHEVLTLVSPSARDKSLGLHLDYDLFLPTRLVGDAARLRQVLVNLVGNAVKFTAEGHVLIRVVGLEVPAEAAAGAGSGAWQLHVTVEDTGIGIPPAQQEHIFGSFAQVESETNRSYEGTGLGLAITRELVSLMGGEIWVDSAEGQGACFGFRVALPSAESPRAAPPRRDADLGRVLQVSAAGLDADIMARQLAQLGFDVGRARSGSEALAALREGPAPDIVAIDDLLPDTDGPALSDALRESGCRAPRLLICASPHDAARFGLGGPPPGIEAVLARPVLRADLFTALGRLADAAAPDLPAPEAAPDAPPETPEAQEAQGDAPAPTPEERSPATAAPAPANRDGDRAHDAGATPDVEDGPDAGGAPDAGETPHADTGAGEDAAPAAHGTGAEPGAPAPGPGGAAADSREAGPSGSDEPPRAALPAVRRPMRVLAAEDNKTNRFVLEKMLAPLDIELHFALDGTDAVEKTAALAPDLVLMDISMPRMDGKDAARAIRAAEARGATEGPVPIVAMTAHALAGDREEILAAGIDHYLSKPLKRALLAEQVIRHCPVECRPPAPPEPRAAAG